MRALWPGGRQPAGVTVKLNVYDLDSPGNEFLSALGLGLYHTGVEVDGREYSYGAGYGIGDARPRSAAQNPGVAQFRGSYVMGRALPPQLTAKFPDSLERVRNFSAGRPGAGSRSSKLWYYESSLGVGRIRWARAASGPRRRAARRTRTPRR